MTLLRKILLYTTLLAGFTACKDQWEDHTAIQDQALKNNIMQEISANPKISRFHDLLVQSDLDEVLKSTKTFTVWAPTNDALQNIDQAVLNNPERLRQFLSNHISYQQYFTHTPLQASSQIRTLSGKNILWDKSTSMVDMAKIEEANKIAGNGVIHIVNAPLTPRLNSWEFLNSSNSGQRQAAFMQTLVGEIFVDSLATQTGVDPETGLPEYAPGTGFVQNNEYFQRVYNLANEDSLYTFIVLTDQAYEAEFNRFRKYYATSDADSTDRLTNFAIVKDLAFRGVYTKETLPEVLVSRSGVQVRIDKSAIVREERTSNGVVFVVNNLHVAEQEKIKPIRVEGEAVFNSRAARLGEHSSRAGNVTVVTRRGDINSEYQGANYQYLRVINHGVSGLRLRYTLPNVPAGKYKVFWSVMNDFQTGAFQQKIEMQPPANPPMMAYKEIQPTFFPVREEIGEYTVDRYGNVTAFLTSFTSTANALNPLTLDYLEFVPVF